MRRLIWRRRKKRWLLLEHLVVKAAVDNTIPHTKYVTFGKWLSKWSNQKETNQFKLNVNPILKVIDDYKFHT